MEIPNAAVPAPDGNPQDESPSLHAVSADIAGFAQSTLADSASNAFDNYSYLMTAMGAVQRTAQRVVDADGSDQRGLSATGTTLLNALNDSASTAANIASRPNTPWRTRQALQQLQTGLRAKAAELARVILPLPAVTSIIVSTPERRATVAALDLAQTARADAAFLEPRPRATLMAGLETLERAAQSILVGDDADHGLAAARLSALSTAIQLTERVAASIGRRANEEEDTRRKAKDLAASLARIMSQLDLVPTSAATQAQDSGRQYE